MKKGTRFLQSLEKLPSRLLAGGAADKSGSSLEWGGGSLRAEGRKLQVAFFAINNNIKNNNKRSPPRLPAASSASPRPGRWGMGARVPKTPPRSSQAGPAHIFFSFSFFFFSSFLFQLFLCLFSLLLLRLNLLLLFFFFSSSSLSCPPALFSQPARAPVSR